MSIEVEIKLRIKDKEKLEKDLRTLDFRKGDLVSESDIYYTSAHHDFEKLDEALRIRSIYNHTTGEKSSVITFKGAKLDSRSMTRKELETEVGDAATAREILESIGFTPVPPVEKQRQHFYKQHITACVDNVKNLGDYLELEKIVDSEEKREEALKELEEMLPVLGYSMEDTTRTSYLSMLMKKEDAEENYDMFRPMRRKQKEIAMSEAKKLLQTERRGILAVNGDDGYPYAIPVNYIYDENTGKIYFHGAKAGHKVDALKKNDKVCFTVYGNEHLEECDWAPYLQSTVVFGRCHLIEDAELTEKQVRAVARKYYPDEEEIEVEMKKSGKAVQLYEITVEHISGKQIQEK